MKLINRIRIVIHRIIKRRSRNLCEICPINIRGLCCYHSVQLEEPNVRMCGICSEHIREQCKIKINNISLDGKKHIIILPYHPCKYLDEDTKLCTIYDRRFEINRQCRTVREGMKLGIFPIECVYVRKNRRYRKGIKKEWYEDVKDKLCLLGQINYNLCNESPHSVIGKY